MDVEARIDALYFWPLALFEAVLIVLALVEIGWNWARGRRSALRENGANVAVAVGDVLLERTVFGAVFYIGLLVAESLAPWRLPINGVTWVAALLLVDFLYYWEHRIEHRVRFFWAYHSSHHSSPEFDLTTAYRLSWLEPLIIWVFFCPMVLLGFDVAQTLVAFVVMLTYQTWIHTQHIGRLGPLEGVVNTPSAHRVHHASNARYLDCNYGGIFMIWDRLFGTYVREDEPVRYGVTQPIGSSNPLVVVFHEYAALARDCLRARSLSDLRRAVVGPPETAG